MNMLQRRKNDSICLKVHGHKNLHRTRKSSLKQKSIEFEKLFFMEILKNLENHLIKFIKLPGDNIKI